MFRGGGVKRKIVKMKFAVMLVRYRPHRAVKNGCDYFINPEELRPENYQGNAQN
jgi:hypothetical protein